MMNLAKPSGWMSGVAILALALGGCDAKAKENEKGGKHEHKPPHNGTLVVFGDEYAHLELVLDPASGTLDGYLLDGEAENPVRAVQKTIEVKVKAGSATFGLTMRALENKLTGETVGDTSQFEVQSDSLKGLKEFDGWIGNVLVKGKAFTNVWFNFPKGNEDE
jgi:hypothetical protein